MKSYARNFSLCICMYITTYLFIYLLIYMCIYMHMYIYRIYKHGPGSSVGIATGYGLVDPGIE
jgi:hypothetical protein